MLIRQQRSNRRGDDHLIIDEHDHDRGRPGIVGSPRSRSAGLGYAGWSRRPHERRIARGAKSEATKGINPIDGSDTAIGSYHPGGANFSMCDGSVRMLSDDIEYATYQRLGARADGEPTSYE